MGDGRGSGGPPGSPAAMWELGDYPGLAELLEPAAAVLVDDLDTLCGGLSGRRFVDVAAGTGNVAVHAAARGATVTACDFAPGMIELGARRTGPAVQWRLAELDALGLEPNCADAIASNFGLIFAPDPDAALDELRRVLVPGGRLAFTAWTRDGFIARMSDRMMTFIPEPFRAGPDPIGPDPIEWGIRELLHDRLAAGFTDVAVRELALRWRFDSVDALTEFLVTHSPTHIAAVAVAGDRAPEMLRSVAELTGSDGGPVAMSLEYLVITARALY